MSQDSVDNTTIGNPEIDAYEYFSGGVPTGEYFRMTLDELRRISDSDTGGSHGISRLQELCFIGLISYFEAFCKDHFASIINLEPSLVSVLSASGQNVSVDATHVVLYGKDCNHRIGFVLARKYDFGTPQKINALFGALLKVTPFSGSEETEFNRLLRDRHLLVHHGGILTLDYLKQEAKPESDLKALAFFDSRVIGKREVSHAILFVEGIARKLLKASRAALERYLESSGLQVSAGRERALDWMIWWDDSSA